MSPGSNGRNPALHATPLPLTTTSSVGDVAEAKLRAPRLPADAIARPRLLDAMSRPGVSVIAIVGPGSSGKSTLVAQWSQQSSGPVAWFTADFADNDPAAFVRGLWAALQRAAPAGTPGPSPPAGSPRAAVDALLEAIAAHPHAVSIVVDDVHLLDDGDVVDLLRHLVEWAPPNLVVVLAGRTVLRALPTARWLVRQRAVLIDGDELALAGDEARALADAYGSGLPPAIVATLHDRCEGWLGGVVLGVQAAERSGDPVMFVNRLRGSSSLLGEFLLAEVFAQHDEQGRADLLDLSVLDRVCAPLYEAVTGRSDGASRLAALARANQFVIPLQDGRWFRFHQLLGEFLRDRAERVQPDRLPALHRRAAAWFRADGDPVPAVDHMLAAGAFDDAADLLRQIGDRVRRADRFRTLRRWFDALPPVTVAGDAALVELALTAELVVPSGAEPAWLPLVPRRQGVPTSLPDALVELQMTGRHLDMRRRLAVGRWAVAEARATGDDPHLSLAALFYGAAALASDEVDEAERAFDTFAAVPRSARSDGQLLTALCWRAVMAVDAGNLALARRVVGDLESLDVRGPGFTPFAALARGLVAVAEGDLEVGIDALRAAADERLTGGMRHVRLVALANLVEVLVALGRRPEAAAALAELDALVAASVDVGRRFARLHAAAAAAVRGTGAGAVTPGTSAGAAAAEDLSPRERQVLRLLHSNLTLREIADQLYLSHNTVKTHVSAVYRKLGVSGRADLRRVV